MHSWRTSRPPRNAEGTLKALGSKIFYIFLNEGLSGNMIGRKTLEGHPPPPSLFFKAMNGIKKYIMGAINA